MIVRNTPRGIQVVVYKSNGLANARRRVVPAKKRRRLTKLGSLSLLLVFLSVIGFSIFIPTVKNKQKSLNIEVSQTTQQQRNTSPPTPVSNSSSSQNDPASLTYVVNKKRQLDQAFVPANLVELQGIKMRSAALNALENMMKAASSEDYLIRLLSGYRSYDDQVWTYQQYVDQYGKEEADTFSARPGHSEHQTGLAVDIGAKDTTCDLEACFAATPLGVWLKDNAHKYGFILRYPEGKSSITGYQYEPWHFRYVGLENAKAINDSGKTMDEYYSVDSGSY